jgi:hypothetical protein
MNTGMYYLSLPCVALGPAHAVGLGAILRVALRCCTGARLLYTVVEGTLIEGTNSLLYKRSSTYGEQVGSSSSQVHFCGLCVYSVRIQVFRSYW